MMERHKSAASGLGPGLQFLVGGVPSRGVICVVVYVRETRLRGTRFEQRALLI